MFCQKCGNEIPDDSTFCAGCGAQINTAQPSGGNPPFGYYANQESQRSAEAIRGQNQEAEKGRNRSQESRHLCGGHCKGRVRPCQQFTAKRADERDADSVNIACR